MNNQKTVLIVDDDPTNLSVLFDYLRTAGFKVLVAENGEAALKRVQHSIPDIVLLDVMMPGINGFETCRRLKANEATQEIPVIFMTALTDSENEVRGLELGAVDYITKPIKMETVLIRINTHLTLLEQNALLEQQNAELDAYARIVAHDISNPLTVVVGYVDYLLNSFSDVDEDEVRHILTEIYDHSQKVSHIVQTLLLLAQVSKEDVPCESVMMDAVMFQTMARLKHQIDHSGAEIILPETWPVVKGYAPWIEQVWFNYLSNGIKYGGTPPILELGATVEVDGVCFWVKDNGAGLTAEEQVQVFEEFVRLKQNKASGHGLGLSIVQRIMGKLGGSYGVESEKGHGCRFYFTLSE